MAEIVLTEEQAAIYRQAKEPVRVRDSHGIILGALDPGLTPEFIAEMKRRASAPGPRYSGAHVQRMLQYLQGAWDKEGPFDEQRMRELVSEFRSKDPECQTGK